MTAKMKMMIHRTKVRLPRAPTVRPMIEISRFNVGHDLASLNTLSFTSKGKRETKVIDRDRGNPIQHRPALEHGSGSSLPAEKHSKHNTKGV